MGFDPKEVGQRLAGDATDIGDFVVRAKRYENALAQAYAAGVAAGLERAAAHVESTGALYDERIADSIRTLATEARKGGGT